MHSVFRQVSLDRLSSPEQLDTLMQVTSSRSWLAFLALASLLVVAVYWGVAGNIPLQIAAPTILLNSGGIKNVVALQDGLVSQMFVEAGDVVAKGQTIAEVVPLGQETPVAVTSPFDGRILELHTGVGALVARGGTLANLEFVGDDVQLEAPIYLSPEAARSVAVGMPVKIVPHSQAQPGMALTGRVVAISDFPQSQASVLRTLGSPELAQTLVGSRTPIEVRVAISRDDYAPETLAGLGIKTGTLANATIVVGNQRPIELVIPLR